MNDIDRHAGLLEDLTRLKIRLDSHKPYYKQLPPGYEKLQKVVDEVLKENLPIQEERMKTLFKKIGEIPTQDEDLKSLFKGD